MVVLIYWMATGKKKKPLPVVETPVETIPSGAEVLRQAYMLLPASDKDFYSVLQQSIWKWLAQRYNLSGTEMNKLTIAVKLRQAGNDEVSINELLQALNQCEAGMFTNVVFEEDREALLVKVRNDISQNQSINPYPISINPNLV